MRIRTKTAWCMAAALGISAVSGGSAMAGSAISIDMTDNNNEAWANIAMVNDDTVETGVNIRTGQNQNAPVAGYLYRGGAVRVLYRGDEWTEIASGDITGYVKNDYLVYGAEAKGLAEYYGTYGVKASWNDVNVFASRSGDSKIVDTAGDGDTYRLVNKDGGWMTVKDGGGSVAYVPAEDVQVVMVLGGAVSVDGTKEDSAAQASQTFEGLDAVADAGQAQSTYEEGSDVSYAEAAYTESTADTSYEDTSYAEPAYTETYEDTSYEDTSYTDTSYSETYEDTSSADTGYSESYEDTSSADTSYTDTTSYTTTVNTSGSYDELAAQASSLYQEYLTAQAAADAAVANGSGEQAIKDTAAAAVAAYGRYVTAQNAADAAQWGLSTDSAAAASTQTQQTQSAETTSYESTDTSAAAEETTYTEDISASETSSQTTQSAAASTSELDLLAALIYCEAGNQPYEGQVAVGAVVMNRVASGSFPNSIEEVIYQGGQFTPAYSGALASALANGSGSGYIGAASDAIAGSDPTGGCLYFNNHRGSGLKIGDHWFY